MNHLVVGLGGSGAQVWQALVERLGPAPVGGEGRVSALLLDTAPGAGSRSHWPSQQVLLNATVAELQALLHTRADLRLAWAPTSAAEPWAQLLQAALTDLKVAGDAANVAGPLGQGAARATGPVAVYPRALARSLLAVRRSELLAALQRWRATLAAGAGQAQAAVCCHVVVQLGAATGAGLLVDVLGLLRLQLPPGSAIHLHAQLPEPDTAGASPWPAAEAQAGVLLQELHALASGQGWPAHLASGEAASARHDQAAFDRCWLSAAVDENGLQSRSAPERLQHAAGLLQLLIDRPDLTMVDAASATSRFVAWGQAQLRCDAVAIRRHLSHELLLRLLNQLRYDHWRPALGVVANPSLAERDQRLDEALLEGWGLSPAHLNLQTGMPEIGVADVPAGALEREWQQLTEHVMSLLAMAAPAQRAAELRRLMDEAAAERFRGVGIVAAFDLPEHELQRRAVAVRQRVERVLWDDWRDGRRSLHGCGQLLAQVCTHLETQAGLLDQQRRGRDTQALQLTQQAEAQMPAAGAGLWSRLGGARRSVEELHPQAYLLRDAALARSWAAQLATALRFGVQLQAQLTTLQGMIDSSELGLGALAHTVDQTAASSLPPQTTPEAAPHSLAPGARLESRELLAVQRARLITDEPVLRDHLAVLRPAAFGCWGDRPSFRALAQWLDEDTSLPTLLGLSESRVPAISVDEVVQAAWAALGTAWQADPRRRERDLRTLQAQAAAGLMLQPEATALAAPTHWLWPQALADQMLADAPAATPAPTPSERLLALLPGAATAVQVAPAPVLAVWRVVQVHTLADWRRVRELQLQQQAFHRRHGSALRRLQLDSAQPAPALLAPTDAQQRELAQATVLLADALGLIASTPADAPKAAACLTHVRRDADGFELVRVALGASLPEATEQQRPYVLGPLFDAVLDQLQARASAADELTRLKDHMQQRIDTLCAAAAPGLHDTLVRAWNDAARTAMKILRQDTTT
jgi:hypothetical protein